MEDVELFRNGPNGLFTTKGKKEIETKNFLGDSRVIAGFIGKLIYIYDDCPNLYYTGHVFR